MPSIHCYFENKAAAACATSALNIFCSIYTAFRCLHRIWDRPGDTEIFSLTSPWEIAENSRLPLSYDAVVSAVSKAVTEQEVLSIVFVLEWGGE